jgi:Putative polyhydroxyalkanoic acid system protein (PHA_gran_rgn)
MVTSSAAILIQVRHADCTLLHGTVARTRFVEKCAMPKMTASIPHQLTRAEAKRRIQEQLGTVRREFASHLHDVQESWIGDRLEFSLTALGQSIAGRLDVDDHSVHVEVDLPWLLAMLAGPVKRQIEDKARRLLAGPS